MMCCFVAQIYYRNLEKTKKSEEKCNAADADHCTYNLFYTGFLLEYQRVRPYDKHGGGESHDGGCDAGLRMVPSSCRSVENPTHIEPL